MIDFLTKPVVAKALLGSVAGLLLLCFALATSAIYYEGRFQAEKAGHAATRNLLAGKLAVAETTVNLMNAAKEADARTIKGLQDQVAATLATLEKQREAAASREAISSKARSVPAKDREVVDDATSREIIRHLNRSLQRR